MIELRDVTRSFGTHTVLRGVSLSFPMGRTTAILGPSGAGKSVMLKLIIGLQRADSGQVVCFGTDMGRASERELFAVRRRFGMLFQDGALFDSLTVGQNIEFPLQHHRLGLSAAERRDRVEEVLLQVGLPGFMDRNPSSLSGGQRKRVGLARAIVSRPEVVLFDEPNSGLDPVTSDSIDALICEMKEALGITFIIITHDIVGALNTADFMGMLHQGQIVAFGPTDEVVHSANPTVRRFLQRNVDLSAPAGAPALPTRPTGLPPARVLRSAVG